MASHPGQVGSSSFEVYIGIEETKTNGHAVLDGSMGYVGRPPEHIQLEFRDGRLVSIEHNESGIFLQDYMERFGDPGIFVAGELGIGLNKKSRCLGNCYIDPPTVSSTLEWEETLLLAVSMMLPDILILFFTLRPSMPEML